jgi:hypothetical protein
MTINIRVGMWMGYKLDKVKTKEVTTEAGAHDDAARVNKHLMPKESLSKIVSKGSAVRNHLYANTLPWKDSGDRLITRQRYEKPFMVEHSTLRGEFYGEVDEFLENKYLVARDQAEFRMGSLFNPYDYPTVDVLRRKFYVSLDIDGISTAYDFRLNDSEEVFQARVTKAMGGLWEKLRKPLEHFADTMADDKKVFRDTTVSNLKDIVAMIPELNFMNDPKLTQIGLQVSKALATFEPKDLRNNATSRATVGNEAAEILESMKGFMNAFGNKGGDDEA